MVFPVYLLTVAISFFTNLGIDIMRPHTLKKMGYTRVKSEFQEYLDENLDLLENYYDLKNGKTIINTFAILSTIFYLIIKLAEAVVPIGNLIISTMRVHYYHDSIEDDLKDGKYINYKKEEERLFGNVANYNKFTTLNIKEKDTQEKEYIDSLILDGADRNQVVQNFKEIKHELNNILSMEKEVNINSQASSMLDYICMNTDLNDKQKVKLLKKLQKAYKNESKENRNPIDYAYECSDKKQKIKRKI